MKINADWKGYRTLAWLLQGLLAITIVVVLFQGEWLPAAALAGFLVISFLFVKLERKLPSLFDLVFMVAALINAGGWAWDLYNKPGPYDEISHFFTIFALTLAFGFLLYRELMESFYDHRLMFVLTIASLGIAIGALWEVTEWLADFVIPKQIVSGLFDTITDLILDSAGAILAALLNLRGLNELRASSSQEQPAPQSNKPLETAPAQAKRSQS
ncbi:MAG TPA: hypothetical protein VFU22_33810 [Roseiflexaceae bacterium]|nr:hypothetical protein [Roseiflexaceae bacterium]